MKPLRNARSTISVTWLIAAWLLAISAGLLGPAHLTTHFRSPDAAQHQCRETRRHTTFDLSEASLDAQMDAASLRTPAPVDRYVAPVAAALVAPAVSSGVPAAPELTFMTRRKLLSPRSNNPDPLI